MIFLESFTYSDGHGSFILKRKTNHRNDELDLIELGFFTRLHLRRKGM